MGLYCALDNVNGAVTSLLVNTLTVIKVGN